LFFICWLAGCVSQSQTVSERDIASAAKSVLITTMPTGNYTGMYAEPDDHGRILTLVVYEAGKPVAAWSVDELGTGKWTQTMERGTGWINHFDPDGRPHYSERFDKGVYSHGVH